MGDAETTDCGEVPRAGEVKYYHPFFDGIDIPLLERSVAKFIRPLCEENTEEIKQNLNILTSGTILRERDRKTVVQPQAQSTLGYLDNVSLEMMESVQ